MSAAANPGPNNLLLLAVIGIGAYWLMTQRARAQTAVVNTNRTATANDLAKLGLVVQGTNLIGRLLTKIGAPGSFYSTTPNITQQGLENVAAINRSDSDPDLNGSISDYASGAIDGLAVNPPGNTAAYDWLGF